MTRALANSALTLACGSFISCVVVGAATAADQGCPGEKPVLCAQASPWYQATELELQFSDRALGESGRWKFLIEDPMNLRIDAQSRRAGALNAGQIVLVDGRAMLTRGLKLEKGYEADVLTEPLLYYQLLAAVLGRVFRQGPGALKGEVLVSVEEATRNVHFAIPGAEGSIGAPWNAKGTLKRRNSKLVEFFLRLDFYLEREDARRVIALSGTWKKDAPPPALPAAMSLHRWQARSIGRGKEGEETLAILDHRPHTLGALRTALQASRLPR
jgi:hypothetical protein